MFLPERVMTNHDVEKLCDTSDEWIVKRTGIRERHVAEEGVGSSDLGTEAAKQALAEAGIGAESLDAIICATVTPDQVAPGTAHLIQANLGANNAAAFDLNAACSGFVYSLATADAYIRTGFFNTILLVGAETTMRLLNWEYRDTAVLFADGAGAVILRGEEGERGILANHLGSDGATQEILAFPGGGFKHTPTPEYLREHPSKIIMNGPELFKIAINKFMHASNVVLEAAGMTKEDLDFFIPHQANARIIEVVREKMGLTPEQVVVNIDHTGNTVAASIPMALHEARMDGRVKEGDIVLLAAFGAGLTWGASLIRW
jgi:3-oxoacyl-[acyl-carrier-protein] synthase-3